MITILRIAIVVFVVWFFYLLVKDSRENGSKDVPMKTKVLYGIMGCILNLLDTLGVGSNATQAAFFKFTKLSPDEELPGNGNVIFAIPVGVEALLFLKIVEVEPVTLFSMLIAAMLGGIVGSKVYKAPGSEDPYDSVSNASVCGSTAGNESQWIWTIRYVRNGNRTQWRQIDLVSCY